MPAKGKKGKKEPEPEPEPEPVVEEKEPDPYENLLVWKDLDEAATNALLEEADPEAQYRLLSETLGMASGEGDTNLRQGILLDFLFYNLQFAQEAGFSAEQTSAFFSVMKATIEGAYMSKSEWVSMEDSFAQFKELFLKHAVDNPPDAVAMFSVDQVQQVTAFVTKSLYRHYRAYTAVFCGSQRTDTKQKKVVVETPLVPPPLSEATMEGDEGSSGDGDAAEGGAGGEGAAEAADA